MRTPFVLRWPGRVPAGKDNTESVLSALDWLPTLCSVAIANCATARPDFPLLFEGENVYNIWSGSDRSRINPLFRARRNTRSAKVSVLQGNWKYHEPGELYDLATDVGETTNVNEREPQIVNAMQKMATTWKASLGSSGMPKVIGPADLGEPR